MDRVRRATRELLKSYELVVKDRDTVIKIQADIIAELLKHPSGEFMAEMRKVYVRKGSKDILEIIISNDKPAKIDRILNPVQLKKIK